MRKALMSAIIFAALSLISAGQARADFWDVMECLFGCSIGGDADIEGTGVDTQQCDGYADNAIKAAAEASSLKCGFDSNAGRFSTNREEHWQWCNGVGWNSVHADRERAARTRQLSQCRACRKYSSKADNQAELAAVAGCKLSGPRWNTDAEFHFNWCMGLNYNYSLDPMFSQLTNHEGAARDQELEECKNTLRPQCTSCHGGSNQVSTAPPAVMRKLFKSTTSSSGFDKNKSATKAAVTPNAAPRETPAAASSSAIDRLSVGPSDPASGGAYKSKDGAPAPTRSSGGGAGTQTGSSTGEFLNLRTMPSNAGSMSTGGGEKFRAPK